MSEDLKQRVEEWQRDDREDNSSNLTMRSRATILIRELTIREAKLRAALKAITLTSDKISMIKTAEKALRIE
jgi:hypothetical protein